MLNEAIVRAYAKINFGLRVFPIIKSQNDGSSHNINNPNPDVYHKIQGIFQTIDLYDELKVLWKYDSERTCKVTCEDMELPEKNTVNSAYQAFCEVLLSDYSVRIPSIEVKLTKGIPSGGGLGGGSSDAAALVRLLEKICGVSLSFEQLDLIASKVGSDVFFFMHCDSEGKGCAIVSGRGEIIENITPRNDLFLLLIFPKVSSSTKIAYDLVDKAFGNKDFLESEEVSCPAYSELEAVYNGSVENWTLKNTFTSIIANEYGEIRNAIEDLKKAGCCFAEMSGSGSTVFGVFTLKQQADSVCDLLAAAWNCKLVRTV